MVIFTKYSNERADAFRIRTEILQDETGRRYVRKSAASGTAWSHIEKIYERSLWLKKDLKYTVLQINDCQPCAGGVQFPYIAGKTLEEELDELLDKGKTEELIEKIRQFFTAFTAENELIPFHKTEEFGTVFGDPKLDAALQCRKVSDIDMIFGNAIALGDGRYELIDYEWTFDFPIPVKYLQYRSLYYYILGNAKRDALTRIGIYQTFGIDETLQGEFAAMEQNFQQYMLGEYCPVWKQYDDISEGVIPFGNILERESRQHRQQAVEIYFDDGRGYGVWNCIRRSVDGYARVKLEIPVPEGTKRVRFDPRSGKCLVRIFKIQQGGVLLSWETNGEKANNGDLIFDTEDGQIYFSVTGLEPVQIEYLAEPLEGIARELVLHQHGRIRWMEGTKAWKLYEKLRGKR